MVESVALLMPPIWGWALAPRWSRAWHCWCLPSEVELWLPDGRERGTADVRAL